LKRHTVQDDRFDGSFLPFSRAPEYIEVNRICAESWANHIQASGLQVNSVLDIATGVGTMANLFMRELWRVEFNPTLTCLDNSKWALELARQSLLIDLKRVVFTNADITETELPQKFDVIIWANGVHYLYPDEQEKALSKIKSALNLGGFFCFNTAFHTEAIAPETRPFYSTKVKKAAETLKETLRLERVRGIKKKAAAIPQSKDHYVKLPQSAGMRVVEVQEHVVRGSLFFWQAIGSFHDYAEGALSGYPVADAVQALIESTEIAFNEHASCGESGERFIERRWLSVIAQTE